MAEPEGAKPVRERRWLRWVGIAGALLLVLLVVAGFFVGRYLRAAVQPDELERLINDTLVTTTDGLYSATVAGIEWGTGGLSLRLTGLSLMLDREVLAAMDRAGTTPTVVFQIQHATVDITGVDLWALLRGNGFRAIALTIEEPLIQVSGLENVLNLGGASRAGDDASRGESPASELATVVDEIDERLGDTAEGTLSAGPAADPAAAEPAAAPGGLPALRLWNVSVRDATLESYRRTGVESDDIADTFQLFERFDNVSIGLDNLDLTHPDRTRLLFADDLRIDIREYYYQWPDGLHEERHGPISLSTGDGYLRISNYSYTPTFERRDRVQEDGRAPTARSITIDAIRVEGLDVPGILEHMDFSAAEFSIEGAEVLVHADPPAPMPERSEPASDLTEPVTTVRPGALLTEVLTDLPEIRVASLHGDFSLEYYVDRDGERWLDTPLLYHAVDNLQLDLQDYVSGPDVHFDPARPLFADREAASADRLVTTLNGRHRVEVEGWRSSSSEQRLAVDALRVIPLFDRRELARRGESPPDRLEVTTGNLVFDQLDYGSLIADVDVEVGELRIEQPRVRVTGSETTAATEQRQQQDQTPAEALGEVLLGLPNIQIDRVVLRDARYEAWVDQTEQGWMDEPLQRFLMDDLDMSFDAMQHRRGHGYDTTRPLLSQAADAQIATIEVALGDGFNRLAISDVAMTSARHDLDIGSLEIKPSSDDRALLGERVETESVPRITTGPIRLVGRVVSGYIESGALELDSFSVDAPEVVLLEMNRTDVDTEAATTEPSPSNTETLAQVLDRLPPIRIGSFAINGARYERRVAAPGHDWAELPDALEALGGLNLTLEGFDTRASRRRLLLSDRVELEISDLELALGGDTLGLGNLQLSSDSDTLTIDDALFSTRAREGNNDYRIGRIEISDVPYGRTFRALIEPPATGTPILTAIADKDMRLMIDGVRGELDDDRRLLEIGTVHGAAAAGTLEIASLSLRPTMPDADPSTPETEVLREETMISTEAIQLSGVDFERLATDGVFDADLLSLQHPELAVVVGIDAPAENASTAPAPSTAAADRSPAEAIAAEMATFPIVQIGRLRITDISLHEKRSLEGGPVRNFDDIQLAIDGLDIRPDRDPASSEGVLYADDIRLQMPQQRTWLNDVGYEIDVGPVALSTGAGTLDLGRAAYLPPYTTDVFLTRTSFIEGDRIEAHVGQVRIEDIDFPRLLRNEGVGIGRVRLADWTLHVLSDKHKPKNPRRTRPGLPNEAFQNLPVQLSVDRIELVNGAVRYSERHKEGLEPGHIWWDQLNGSIVNLSNEPSRMTMETPAVLSVEARMLDEAYLKLEWKLPLLESGPTMSYSAELSPFRATLLSSILVPIEGVRIKDGVFDQTWFNVDIRDGHGTGTFNGLYHDLKIQLEDRNTGGRSLGQRLLSFAANVILPSNNRDQTGKPARAGQVDYTFPPEGAPIFKVFWDAIKSGVLDLAM